MHPDQAGYLRAPLAAPAHSPFLDERTFLDEPDWAEDFNLDETETNETEL